MSVCHRKQRDTHLFPMNNRKYLSQINQTDNIRDVANT